MADSTLGKEYVYNFARGSLRCYLDGKKNLNWVMGMIRTSLKPAYGLQKAELAAIFDELKGRGDVKRYKEAYEKCKSEGLL